MFAIKSLLDFFLPRICPVCENVIEFHGSFVCDSCYTKLKIAPVKILETEFDKKFSKENFINDFSALYIFEKDAALQSVIHELKYGNKFVLGRLLGMEMAYKLQEKILSWSADFLIPVPLHQAKRAERGYNQAEFLCKGISKELKIPVKTGLLKRTRFTSTQTQLNLSERKINVAGAFIARQAKSISDKKIILIDDVVTTGSTVSECGKALQAAGARKVFALSLAIAE